MMPPTTRPLRSRAPGGKSLGSAGSLLNGARHSLTEAAATEDSALRYAAAHLAALRSAAAVLAARARPETTATRRAPRSVWAMLPAVAAELDEWAIFFAAGAGKRAAAEAGLPHAVTRREADDLLRDAETFLGVVEGLFGLVHQPLLPAIG